MRDPRKADAVTAAHRMVNGGWFQLGTYPYLIMGYQCPNRFTREPPHLVAVYANYGQRTIPRPKRVATIVEHLLDDCGIHRAEQSDIPTRRV
jgi:hypothetical protein